MRMSANIGMNSDRINKLLFLAVEVVEVVFPQLLHIFRIDPSVAIRRLLNEHHRRQIVKVPIRGYLDQSRLLPLLQRRHPMVGMLAVVYRHPGVSGA